MAAGWTPAIIASQPRGGRLVMTPAATVLVCALELLGRSPSSFPPIKLLDVRPAHASVNAEAFVATGVNTIYTPDNVRGIPDRAQGTDTLRQQERTPQAGQHPRPRGMAPAARQRRGRGLFRTVDDADDARRAGYPCLRQRAARDGGGARAAERRADRGGPAEAGHYVLTTRVRSG